MRQEPITERDERLTKQSQEAMPESQKAMRMNGEVKVKVYLDEKRAVVVKVAQQGTPHPKGFTAAIDHTVGPMSLDGATRQVVEDEAIDFVKGKKTSMRVEEFEENEPAKDVDQKGENMTPEQAEANRIAAAGGSEGL